jgi:hypothetical protein
VEKERWLQHRPGKDLDDLRKHLRSATYTYRTRAGVGCWLPAIGLRGLSW